MTIGQRIKHKRSVLNLTLEDVAKRIGTSKQTIQRYETGVITNIPSDKIEALASALNTTPSYIMGWDEMPSASNILPLPETKMIPLLGTIACGEPITAVENVDDYLAIDKSIAADFALRCKGDSMINARIFDGDLVYIAQHKEVRNGDIAAVLIGDEATLKKVHFYENKLVLSPANPMYDDLVYTGEKLEEIKILGKAVAFTSLIK